MRHDREVEVEGRRKEKITCHANCRAEHVINESYELDLQYLKYLHSSEVFGSRQKEKIVIQASAVE